MRAAMPEYRSISAQREAASPALQLDQSVARSTRPPAPDHAPTGQAAAPAVYRPLQRVRAPASSRRAGPWLIPGQVFLGYPLGVRSGPRNALAVRAFDRYSMGPLTR